MKTVMMKIADLVEDMALYPRHAVDSQHVAQIALALEAGERMPPVRADKKSKRIVDGFHRLRAMLRVFGPEAEVEVELCEYKSELEIILDAIRLNSHHGRRLDRMDQVRAIRMAEAVGADKAMIAVVLHVPERQVEKLRVRVATVAASAEQAVPHTTPSVLALKRPVLHFAGRRMTKEQAEAHESMPGTSFALLCTQLVMAMENDLVNRADEPTMQALEELSQVLGRYLKTAAA
jgi:hypothetical protein